MRWTILSIFFITACGGIVSDASDGPSGDPGGGAGPNDALACANEARITTLARDARTALPQIVTDGAFAYWARRGEGSGAANQIVRSPLAGGAIEVLVPGVDPQGLAVDATHVYWTERVLDRVDTGRLVARVPKAGGAVETVVPPRVRMTDAGESIEGEGVDAWRIAVDDDAIVFTGRIDPEGGGSFEGIYRAQKAPANAKAFTELVVLSGPEPTEPMALAMDSASVYWVTDASRGEYAPDRQPVEAALRTAPKDGPTRGPGKVLSSGPTFAPKGQDVRFSLGVDADGIYWLSPNDGAVVKISKSGGAPSVLAADQRDFSAIAVGGGFVYWSWTPQSGSTLGGARRVSTTGGPVTSLANGTWLRGVAYDPAGLVLAGGELARLTTCP